MKKLLLTAGSIGVMGGIFSLILISTSVSSNTSCKEVEFSNNVTACVAIEQNGSDWRLTTDVDNGSTANLRCEIMTPDSILQGVSTCNGTFDYNDNNAGRVKIWIRYNSNAPTNWEDKPSNNSERTYPQWVYNFDTEERTDDTISNNTSNGDLDNFYLTTDDTTPSTSQYVDLTIKARDSDNSTITDYRDAVDFKVYYRSSSSSSWTLTTSSTYYDMDTDYDNGYDFTSSDDGITELSNFIKFKKNNYDYKVRVYATDDSSIYKEITFDVGSTNNSTSNGDLDNLYLTTDDTTPSMSQYVDLTIKARDSDNATITDYRDEVDFKVYYKSSSSSSWTETTSAIYYTINSSYTNGYDFTSSDDGIAELSNFIKFNRNNYDFKVRVYATTDSSTYKEIIFNVGSTNNSSSNGDLDNFYITTDDTTPSTSQYVDLTIKARDSDYATITDYRDTVDFKVYYRSSSSSSWTETTSSTYYDMDPDYDNGYDFTSSDDGIAELSNFIKFKKNNYDYKVKVYATDDNSTYKEITFDVGSTSNSTSNYTTDNFYITADDTTPATSQYIDLTVKARNGTVTDTAYRGTVQFEVYYKTSNSSTRTKTTSSTYYNMVSTYEDNGYTFISSNNGQKTFSNIIKFNRNNYSYKVVIYDGNDEAIEGYKIFTVGSTSSSSSVNGFSSSEFNTIEGIYDGRDNMISTLENDYSRLKNSTRWQTMSDNLKDAIKEIIDDDSNKTYDNFDDFNTAWLERYRYTISTR